MAGLCIFLFSITGCNNDVSIPDGAFDENTVDLRGTWTVAGVTLNGVDISDRMEFSRMTLQLEMDGNGPTGYQIENDGIPFLVTENGSWFYDDKVYPTLISFDSPGKNAIATFSEPPLSGGSNFSIAFSLGCADNIYVYHLTRQ